eukprot:TRINITY_DN26484_c0_g6_i3.p1 TRINITY_DN26484_c0_g6~~TRINITY_DN26484_c0_g6_i3.p1  ORF type:complete len:605 (-),score=188.48 TRINITY_DN26484_c0_g6_i3:41-1810(-)
MSSDTGHLSDAETSRQRIESAGKLWYMVLNVNKNASSGEVKQAFHRLALLHHPDKGGDVSTFKIVQEAYEAAMIKFRKSNAAPAARGKAKVKAKGKGKAKTSYRRTDSARQERAERGWRRDREKAERDKEREQRKAEKELKAQERIERQHEKEREKAAAAAAAAASPTVNKKKRPKPVPDNVTKVKLRSAISKWELTPTTFPDEIPLVKAETLATWVRASLCVPVDVRENPNGRQVLGSVSVSYYALTTEPETVTSVVLRLREDGRKLVIVSQKAERFGVCGLAGALLLDVFGLDEANIFRLEGGYEAWMEYVASDRRMLAEEALEAAVRQMEEVEKPHEVSKQALAEFEEGARIHLEPILAGSWKEKTEAKAHHTALAPQLGELELEESVSAMFEFAATKDPKTRGRFDAIIFQELKTRFEKKIAALRATFEALDAKIVARQATWDAAKKELMAANLAHVRQSGEADDGYEEVDMDDEAGQEVDDEDEDMGEDEEGEEEAPIEEPEDDETAAAATESQGAEAAPGSGKAAEAAAAKEKGDGPVNEEMGAAAVAAESMEQPDAAVPMDEAVDPKANENEAVPMHASLDI